MGVSRINVEPLLLFYGGNYSKKEQRRKSKLFVKECNIGYNKLRNIRGVRFNKEICKDEVDGIYNGASKKLYIE